jgi:flagellar basal-body rod protein FlgF
MYAAYTGLLARTQALDTAANNLANTGTVGFRAQRDYFRSVLTGLGDGVAPSQVGNAVNDFGVLGGSLIDQGEGAVTATGNPLDLALDGQGFFAIQTQAGTQYTRDGSFTRSPTGQLQTQQGEAVLDVAGQPITVPSGAVSVGPDGSVSVTTDVGSAIVGQVGVFGFPQGAAMVAEGTNRFTPPTGVQAALVATPIQDGSLEGANVDAVHGTMQLILVQRQAEMMQKALSTFNNDFDKTAAEELGRV